MGAIDSIGNSMMTAVITRAQNSHSQALLSLLDASRKIEIAHVAPLSMYGVGNMVDVYA